jgi:hypothetical protein
VEFTSLFAFVLGFLFGPFVGVSFGGFVMFVNGFFSPWGFAGLMMPFQVAGMALTGLVGGLYRKYSENFGSGVGVCLEVSVLGAFLTVVYDLITNLGAAVPYMGGMPPAVAVMTALAYGAPFSVIHVFSNIAVFGAAFLPIVKALKNVLMVKNVG